MKDKLTYYHIYSISGLSTVYLRDKTNRALIDIENKVRGYVSVADSELEIENLVKDIAKLVDYQKFDFTKSFTDNYDLNYYLRQSKISNNPKQQLLEVIIDPEREVDINKTTYPTRFEYTYKIPLCFKLKLLHSVKEEVVVDGKTFHRFEPKSEDIVKCWQKECKKKYSSLNESIYHEIKFMVEKKEFNTNVDEIITKINLEKENKVPLSAVERMYLELD